MSKSFNRVTHERIEEGLVVSGSIGSGQGWVQAYRMSLRPWQFDAIITEMLFCKINDVLDRCECPSDIAAHEKFLESAWSLIGFMELALKDDKEISELKKYENDVRSGECFKDDEEESNKE